MRDLVADRFVWSGGSPMDLASGAPVHVQLVDAGTPAQQAVWADRCASLSRLRHPLLNALLDYGAAGRHHLFEAYAIGPPVRAAMAPAARLLRHVARFLESHALPLRPGLAGRVVREVACGAGPCGRPLGIVLQRRPVLDAIEDVLRDATAAGVVSIDVRGDSGSGVRTLWMLTARAARLAGYIPIAARVLPSRPWLAELLLSRHVALLVEPSADRHAQQSVAALVARLGAASTRHHIVITFGRGGRAGSRALQVDRMGGTAMSGMVYRDHEEGPCQDEVQAGVRMADGRPGALVELLGAAPFERRAAQVALLHESSVEYGVGSDAPAHRPPARRVGAALTGALGRAQRLAAGGRHGTAMRLLARAVRVLAGRGEPLQAARCGVALGWIHRDRGRSAQALQYFEQARMLAAGSAAGLQATIGRGVVWTDEDRLVDAEALLRSAQSAAALLDDTGLERGAALALARCLLWRGKQEEASAILGPVLADRPGVEAWALAARVHLAAGAAERAGRAAARGLECAAADGSPRALAVAARASTLVRGAVGDATGAQQAAREGLAAAAAAHLPLLAIRLRAALLTADGGSGSGASGEQARRLARLAAARTALPALLRRQIEAAGRAVEERSTGSSAPGFAGADLRVLLETTQSAPDDQSALQALADAVAARLRASSVVIVTSQDTRVVVRAGRAWGSDPAIAIQAMAANRQVRSTAAPPECASPITYGVETIGSIGCRWSAGAVVDLDHAAAVCAAAALAAAASLRGVADRGASPPPDATWDDLLGTSPSATELRKVILNAARAPFPVLVVGESGSGKEIVARAIHRLGPRRHRRICTINCAAISDELVEAELFGHTRGAFTGAIAERPGLFEEADGGTLFLDEVGELSGRAQAKLLRVLQDGEVRRVGENMPRRVDTRVISATNRCLEQEVQAGRFRADLRFRLDVIRIQVPPLRDRATDIPALVAHFWEDATARVGSRATLAPETVAALTRYEWPGNVRELQNAVASLAVHGPRRGRITPGTLPSQLARAATPIPASFEAAREEFERRFVRAALARAGGRRTGAARALGVSRQGLSKMLRRLRIEEEEETAG